MYRLLSMPHCAATLERAGLIAQMKNENRRATLFLVWRNTDIGLGKATERVWQRMNKGGADFRGGQFCRRRQRINFDDIQGLNSRIWDFNSDY